MIEMPTRPAYVQAIEEELCRSKSKLERYRNDYFQNEAQTRYALIDPVLRTLGWDLGNPEQVKVEHYRIEGNRADYEFYVADRQDPIMVVEAKRISEDDISYILGEIEDSPEDIGADWIEWGEEEVGQLGRYVRDLKTGYGVLTDGNAWGIWDLSKWKSGDRKPELYVWALCEALPYVSYALKVLHRRNLQKSG
jgi:predicted type IV restriction endonuclease